MPSESLFEVICPSGDLAGTLKIAVDHQASKEELHEIQAQIEEMTKSQDIPGSSSKKVKVVAGARFGLSLPIQEKARRACLLESSGSQVYQELMGEVSKNPLYRLFHLADVAAGCLPILKRLGRPPKKPAEKQSLSLLR